MGQMLLVELQRKRGCRSLSRPWGHALRHRQRWRVLKIFFYYYFYFIFFIKKKPKAPKFYGFKEASEKFKCHFCTLCFKAVTKLAMEQTPSRTISVFGLRAGRTGSPGGCSPGPPSQLLAAAGEQLESGKRPRPCPCPSAAPLQPLLGFV